MSPGNNYPKISIITPSFNQADYLEKTILSIINQNYSNLEYIIIDGGSTDGSVEIIKKYQDKLSYWISEPDNGQYDAINKGFSRSSGDIMAYINSDDIYHPSAFSVIADIFSKFPDVEWVTSLYPTTLNYKGQIIACGAVGGFDKNSFYRGVYVPRADNVPGYCIQQESTFWRRSLWDKIGGSINSSLMCAGDFDLWSHFFQYAELFGVYSFLGGFRKHQKQKTTNQISLYLHEVELILKSHNIKQYNRMHNSIHCYLNFFLGKFYNGKIFSPIGKIFIRLGIFFPVNVIRWDGTQWNIETNYVI
jgi:glycosyltransferase involved in cell wall biosynthesis